MGHLFSFMSPIGILKKNLISNSSYLKKKKKISLFWIQIGETLVLSISGNSSRKSLSWRSDWEGPFPLFDGSISDPSKKKGFKKKKKPLRFHQLRSLTKVDLRKSLVQSVEAARLFEARVLQTGSLSNPTLT